MLLNKIPVLDDGYVALISSAMSHLTYKDVVDEFFGTRDHPALKKCAYATLIFKAPVFAQLYFAQHGLCMVSTRITERTAYKPNAGEIGSSDHDVNRLVADDISRTTEALLINPSAYVADGADPFMAQVIMPISSYATFIVGGTLEQWEKVYQFKSVPAPIKGYINAIEQIMKAEWK